MSLAALALGWQRVASAHAPAGSEADKLNVVRHVLVLVLLVSRVVCVCGRVAK